MVQYKLEASSIRLWQAFLGFNIAFSYHVLMILNVYYDGAGVNGRKKNSSVHTCTIVVYEVLLVSIND